MISGSRINLRPWRKEDIDLFIKWFNDPEVTIYIGNAFPNLTREAEEHLYEEHGKEKDRTMYVIELKDTGQAIGNCSLFDIDLKNRSGEIGIVIGEKDYWSKGYGREAINLLLQVGFDGYGLNRIQLRYGDFNRRGENCYRAVGFKEEGRLRQAWYVKGEYYDEVMTSILASEYRERID